MRFSLYYRGPLHTNGDPEHKHELRQCFHEQLKNLPAYLQPNEDDARVEIGGFRFAPLVRGEFEMVADLRIIMLRPGPRGNIVSSGGDIDNRLKTLFDALSAPRQENQLPNGARPKEDQDPFLCLLEDDSLIVGVAVETDILLDTPCRSEVVLLIQVTIDAQGE